MTKYTRIATLFFSSLALVACGDDDAAVDAGADAAGDAAVSCLTMDPVVEIMDNHLPSGGDHELVIPLADVLEGTDKTYDIRGDNMGHTHEVTVTAADFALLREGTRL